MHCLDYYTAWGNGIDLLVHHEPFHRDCTYVPSTISTRPSESWNLEHLLQKTPLCDAIHRNNFLHWNKSFFGLIYSGGGWVSTHAGNQIHSYCMLIWLQVKGSCYLRKKVLYILYNKPLCRSALFFDELKSSGCCSLFCGADLRRVDCTGFL